jgi:ech hydrogenase subunit D
MPEQQTTATLKRDPQVFIDIQLPALRSKVEAYHAKGWRFVNLNGSTVPDGVELIYAFSDQEPIENLRLVVGSTDEVPSISDLYFNSFFFENETHDLYGVNIKGIAIDFGGKFYKTSVPTPFNPASEQAQIRLIERNAADAATPNDPETEA